MRMHERQRSLPMGTLEVVAKKGETDVLLASDDLAALVQMDDGTCVGLDTEEALAVLEFGDGWTAVEAHDTSEPEIVDSLVRRALEERPDSYQAVLRSLSLELKTPALSKKLLGREPTETERCLMSLNEINPFLDDVTHVLADAMVTAVPTMPVDTHDVPARLAAEMVETMSDVAEYGAWQVVLEFDRQEVEVEPGVEIDVGPAIDQVTADLHRVLYDGWTRMAAGLDRRRMPVASRPKYLKALMERDTEHQIRRLAADTVNSAFAFGRSVQMLESHKDVMALVGIYEFYVMQSAVLDKRTCVECSDVDGEVAPYGSDRQQELLPPYVLCLGGENCRCQQIGVSSRGTVLRLSSTESTTLLGTVYQPAGSGLTPEESKLEIDQIQAKQLGVMDEIKKLTWTNGEDERKALKSLKAEHERLKQTKFSLKKALVENV